MTMHPLFEAMTDGIFKLHRLNDPVTSREAAEAVYPAINKIQQHVLNYAEGKRKFGFTDIQLNDYFGSTSSTYRSRRAELTAMGLIVDSGRTMLVGKKRHTVWVHRDFAS